MLAEVQIAAGFFVGFIAGIAAWLLKPIVGFIVTVMAFASAFVLATSGVPALISALEGIVREATAFTPFFASLAVGGLISRVLLSR